VSEPTALLVGTSLGQADEARVQLVGHGELAEVDLVVGHEDPVLRDNDREEL
jgi:hypothetical protein